MRRFFKRIASLFGPRHAENELRREIESHLRILQDDFEKTGLSPAEAKLRQAKLWKRGVRKGTTPRDTLLPVD